MVPHCAASTCGRALPSQNMKYLLVNTEAFGLPWHLGWQVTPGLWRGVASAQTVQSPLLVFLGYLVCVTNILMRKHPVVKSESEENPRCVGILAQRARRTPKTVGYFSLGKCALGCTVESLGEGTSGWNYRDRGPTFLCHR